MTLHHYQDEHGLDSAVIANAFDDSGDGVGLHEEAVESHEPSVSHEEEAIVSQANHEH